MAVIKCKMCGGDVLLAEGKTVGLCEYCGSTITLPRIDSEQRAAVFNRGNEFRRIGEFDKALGIYERIVEENDADAEAHWCCVLCRYGIEYVEDPDTAEYLPTCHRASFDSVLEDPDYKAALEHSDGVTRRQYIRDAAKIAEVQKGILATSSNEEPFDVFISYKETDDKGSRTLDATLAQDIYYRLTEKGYRVFFSRITLEGKPGTEYEPYIFAALNSSRVMVLVGTSAANINSVWVKNEWSRFMAMRKKDRSKLLIPCYRDMDPYDLPEQISVLKAYDMGQIGFIQDLIHGIAKVIDDEKPKPAVKETVVVQQSASAVNISPLLKRAFMFLEDGDWASADDYCERVLDQDPENARAYLGKLMAELKVKKQERLQDQPQPFDRSSNYTKAYRFGDAQLKKALEADIQTINNRNEQARLDKLYNEASIAMTRAGSERDYQLAAGKFDALNDYKDSREKAKICRSKAEDARKDALYQSARNRMEGNLISSYEGAIADFRKLSGWKDSEAQIRTCQQKIQSIKDQQERERKAREEKERLEREAAEQAKRVAEQRAMVERQQAEMKAKAAKRRNKILAMVAVIAIASSVISVIYLKGLVPMRNYNAAMSLKDSGKYAEAYEIFATLSGYKDVDSLLKTDKNLAAAARAAQFEKGKTVTFGSYEQDNNTSNGKEDIEWLVLDNKDGQVLLISKYALACKPYNEKKTDVTWESCTLRTWLNSDFLQAAFTAEEQKQIRETQVTADKNPKYNTSPGKDTTDKIFLLSIPEAEKYFASDAARACQATAVAKKQGAYVASNGNSWWWLRSPGYDSGDAAIVDDGGSLSYSGNYVYYSRSVIRPALWVKY